MNRNAIWRLLLALAVVSGAAPAQIQHLTTDFAGDVLYFASNHIINDRDPPHSKIFRWDRNGGVRVFRARTRQEAEPLPGRTSMTNFFELTSPSVSRDGALLAFAGHRLGTARLAPPFRESEQVVTRTVDHSIIFPVSGNSLLGLLDQVQGIVARTEISANGRFLSPWGRGQPSATIPVDGSPATPLNSGFNLFLPHASRGTLRMIADDGTAVYLDRDNQIWTSGPQSRQPRRLRTPRRGMVPAISASAEVVVYESLYWDGEPRQLYAYDLTTDTEKLLFVDAKVERFGPGRLVPFLFEHPYTPEAQVPLFDVSMDDGGWNILALAREAADKPRQWLFTIHPDASDPRWFARVQEGYREAVISGNGQVIFAVTESGRLLRIDVPAGQIEEILPRTPWIGRVEGSGRPGAENRIRGGGFADEQHVAGRDQPVLELAGLRVTWQGRPVPILEVSPREIRVRIPLDFTDSNSRLLTLDVPSPSPLRPAVWSRMWPEHAATNPQPVRSPGPMHADGEPVSSTRPARVGEELRILVTGLDLSDWSPDAGTADVISAGEAPGLPGVVEIVFRLKPPVQPIDMVFFFAPIPLAP